MTPSKITTSIQCNDAELSFMLDEALSSLGGSVNCLIRLGTNVIEYDPSDAIHVARAIQEIIG